MERFSEKLRQSRKRVRLSQSQLAERVGVTQRSMTNYECGRAVPRMPSCPDFHDPQPFPLISSKSELVLP